MKAVLRVKERQAILIETRSFASLQVLLYSEQDERGSGETSV